MLAHSGFSPFLRKLSDRSDPRSVRFAGGFTVAVQFWFFGGSGRSGGVVFFSHFGVPVPSSSNGDTACDFGVWSCIGFGYGVRSVAECIRTKWNCDPRERLGV